MGTEEFYDFCPGRRQIIDVYWLADDGGLTLLLPHLMSINAKETGVGIENLDKL